MTYSNYILVAISLDRHLAITKPLSISWSPYKLLSTACLLSLLPSLPCIFIFTVEPRVSEVSTLLQPECVTNFSNWTDPWRIVFYFGVAILVFFIPLVTFIILFSHIIYELCATVNRMKNNVSLLVCNCSSYITTFRLKVPIMKCYSPGQE